MSPDAPHWHFLVNPAAGRGRTARSWERWLPRLEAALPGLTWAVSDPAAGMSALAEGAVRNGKLHLVGVGGDGTHNDVVNGIVAAGGLGQVTYAPLPLGTGNDWVRTLGTPRGTEEWIAVLKARNTIPHRVGKLELIKTDSTTTIHHFINVAGMAYDAVVVRRSEESRVKHRWLYPVLTLAFLRDFTAPTVRIDYDGHSWAGPVHTINLGIGRYSGGGMRLVPQAQPTADNLALTFAERLPLLRILRESWRFYTPTIGRVKGVTVTHADAAEVTPQSGRLEVEADGEWLGEGTVRVSLLSEHLSVVVP